MAFQCIFKGKMKGTDRSVPKKGTVFHGLLPTYHLTLKVTLGHGGHVQTSRAWGVVQVPLLQAGLVEIRKSLLVTMRSLPKARSERTGRGGSARWEI